MVNFQSIDQEMNFSDENINCLPCCVWKSNFVENEDLSLYKIFL